MLIGFNNIHFSWKETILLIEERRERRERARRGRGRERERLREGKKKKARVSFHFQVRPWDDAFEKALYRFRANEIKWCRPWQKGKPKLKAIYFHWGMWHCSGTINGLNIDTDMERENKKKERERETKIQSNDWWHRWVKREQSLDLDRLAVMIPIILFLSLFFSTLLSLNWECWNWQSKYLKHSQIL